MPNFVITKYKVSDANATLAEFNFSDSTINGKYFPNFINDFINIPPKSPESLLTEINISYGEGKTLKVLRDYTNSTTKVTYDKGESNDYYNALSTVTGINANFDSWRNLIVDFTRLGISSLEQFKNYVGSIKDKFISKPKESNEAIQEKLKALKANTYKDLTPDEVTKLGRSSEVKLKIKKLEEDVNFYQNEKKIKEDLKKKKDKLENEKKSLADKMASVEMLTETRTRLNSELEKFQKLSADPALESKVTQIKTNRSSQLLQVLKTLKKGNGFSGSPEEEKEQSLFTAKWLIILAFLQIVISLGLFISTFEIIHLILGGISSVTIVAITFLVNIYKYTYNYESDVDYKPTGEVVAQNYGDVLPKLNKSDDKFLVDVAWSNALKSELDQIEKSMQDRLGDQSIDSIMSSSKNSEDELARIEQKLKNLEGKALSSEEYYKKRRELDILKIEKENIDYSFDNKIDKAAQSEIDALELQLNGVENEPAIEIDSLPLVLINIPAQDEFTQYIGELRAERQAIIVNL